MLGWVALLELIDMLDYFGLLEFVDMLGKVRYQSWYTYWVRLG